jgi:hypothetical protein
MTYRTMQGIVLAFDVDELMNEVLLPDDVCKAQCLDVDVGVGVGVGRAPPCLQGIDVGVELIRPIPRARSPAACSPVACPRHANPFHSELTMAPSQLLVAILDIDTNDF